MTFLNIRAPERAKPLSVTVWYPMQGAGTPVRVGANGVFQGTAAQRDAPVAAGAFPIVLVSQGGMRSAPNLAGWIDAALAGQGFVVADVHAVRLGPREARRGPDEVWRRPADLSAALSALEADARFSGHLSPKSVGALGFFLGGTAVLSLAGGRLDAERYAAMCDEGGGIDCAWFAKAGVDLHRIDTAKLTESHRDPRITVAIVVDPELSGSFSRASLAALAAPVDVINLGSPGEIPRGLDASGLARDIPGASYHTVPDATQFSAFSLCKPKGAAILAEAGESTAFCDSDAKAGRAHIHADLARMIGGVLDAHLHRAP